MRVLIADDDVVITEVLEILIRDLGHEVVIAYDGLQAWELMQAANAPSLAILDWLMPGMAGTDICRELRGGSKRPYQYLIMLTAKGEKQDLVESMEAGADDYLRKPFDERELRARVHAGERMLARQDELLARATFDDVTGLLNRAAISRMVERELERSSRRGEPASVIMIDLDNFKRVNDTYGHAVGDEVLREAAKRLGTQVRSYDDLGRYGGEEFLVPLSGCDDTHACEVAERMRKALSAVPCSTSAGPIHLTASFGVATTHKPCSAESLVAEADAALYRAKHAGRDRVER